jgi:hypothetical protein
MVTVSFNKEFVTVIVSLQDDNIYELAREYALDQGVILRDFDNLTIEDGHY